MLSLETNLETQEAVLNCFQNLIMFGFIDHIPLPDNTSPITVAEVEYTSISKLLRKRESVKPETPQQKQQYMIDVLILSTCYCSTLHNPSHSAIMRTISIILNQITHIVDWQYSVLLDASFSIFINCWDEEYDSLRTYTSEIITLLLQRVFTQLEITSNVYFDIPDDLSELLIDIIGPYKPFHGRRASCTSLVSSTKNIEIFSPDRKLPITRSSPTMTRQSPIVDRRGSEDVQELRRRSPSATSPMVVDKNASLLSYFLPMARRKRSEDIFVSTPTSALPTKKKKSKEYTSKPLAKIPNFEFELLRKMVIRQDEDQSRHIALAVMKRLSYYAQQKIPRGMADIRTVALQILVVVISKWGTYTLANERFLEEVSGCVFDAILLNLILTPVTFKLCIQLFELVLGKFESIWRGELSAIMAFAIVPMMDSAHSTFFQRITILQFLMRVLSNVPALELYKRFTTAKENVLVSIYDALCHMASKHHFDAKWITQAQDSKLRTTAADLALEIMQSVNQSLHMELERKKTKQFDWIPEDEEKFTPVEVDDEGEVIASQMSMPRRKYYLFNRESAIIVQQTKKILSNLQQEQVGSVMATISADVWDDEDFETPGNIREDDEDDLDLNVALLQKIFDSSLQLLDTLFKFDSYYNTCIKYSEMLAQTATKLGIPDAFGPTISCIAHNTRLLVHVADASSPKALASAPQGSSHKRFASFASFFGGNESSNPSMGTTTPVPKPKMKFNIECAKLMLKLVHAHANLMTWQSWSDVIQCVTKIENLPETYREEFIMMQAAMDTLFVNSASTNGREFSTFIQGLCDASRNNLVQNSNTRYGLDKLIEVAYFNMNRPDEERILMWTHIGDHLAEALYLTLDQQILTWIMDTMRQLAETFLEQNRGEQELLPDFARKVMGPFYHAIHRSELNPIVRDKLIMNCLGPIIFKKYAIIRSGWGCILKCIGRVAEFESGATMLEYLFDEFLSMMMVRNDYFSVITENDSFEDLVECLAKFAASSQPIAVYAIEFVSMCAQNLAIGKVPTKDEDHTIRLWKSLFTSLCKVVQYAERVEVRHNALEHVLSIIRSHCMGKHDTKFWNEIFGKTLLQIVKNAIETECKSTIIEATSPISPTESEFSDVKRCAALVTEWVGMTLPRMMQGIQNLICDLYVTHTDNFLFEELIDTICSFFVHEQRHLGQLEKYVIYNTKLAEIGAECMRHLLTRMGNDMTLEQWTIIRDRLRDLVLVDTNGPCHISRFVFNEDVFDVEYQIHATLVELIKLLITSYCGTKKINIVAMTLDDIQMFLEIIWSSYKGAQELHQQLLSEQIHTQRVTRQYARMVHLRPRLIRHESMTLKAYLGMLFKMLHVEDSPETKSIAQELLLPVCRDLISSYLVASQGQEIFSPATPNTPVDEIQIGTKSKDLVRINSPSDDSPVRGFHRRTSSQAKIEIDTTRRKRRKSVETIVPASTVGGTLYLKEHMDHDSKMTNELVQVISIILDGYLAADEKSFVEFVDLNYDALSDLILSDAKAVREPLRAVFSRRRKIRKT